MLANEHYDFVFEQDYYWIVYKSGSAFIVYDLPLLDA